MNKTSHRKVDVMKLFSRMLVVAAAVAAMTGTAGLPLLLLSGGEERVVSLRAMVRWFDRLETADKTHLQHPGHLHELFNAPDWERIAGEVVSWMRARVPNR